METIHDKIGSYHDHQLNAGQEAQLKFVKEALEKQTAESAELKETIQDLMGHFQAEQAIQGSSSALQDELAEGSITLQKKPKRGLHRP